MDVSFALQALCVRGTGAARRVSWSTIGVPVPAAIDREVGRLKLQALDVAIDEPTADQSGLP